MHIETLIRQDRHERVQDRRNDSVTPPQPTIHQYTVAKDSSKTVASAPHGCRLSDLMTENRRMTRFDDAIVTAVLAHMNDDHSDDNLLIVRAFAKAEATEAVMADLDMSAGYWDVDGERVEIPWPITVTERPHVREAVVKLYEDACTKLGVPQREH